MVNHDKLSTLLIIAGVGTLAGYLLHQEKIRHTNMATIVDEFHLKGHKPSRQQTVQYLSPLSTIYKGMPKTK